LKPKTTKLRETLILKGFEKMANTTQPIEFKKNGKGKLSTPQKGA